ncbi:MAG: alpha/beta hydrolase, partial [Rhodospirillaceae bacterium]|nr:alpha/beta hydrolase [Rhodospirillaceae bacterium]
PAYWSSHRYSEEVVASMSDAVEQAKRESGARRVRLFGYSGGGALAVLIAARRTDVIGVTTLAANLDHQFWTQQGGMTPLYGSLNPAHVANEISHIPQIHFIGEDDETVPNSVAYAYMSDIKDTSRIRIVKLPDMDHTCCWVEPWKNLLRNYVNR